jgi:endonuclease/exonuclease/phosphatase family metal-dependent hydrolase
MSISHTNQAPPLRVVTWNILAQSFVQPKRYPKTPPEILEAQTRIPKVLARLKEINADVYCLQEVEPEMAVKIQGTLGGADVFLMHYAQRHGHADGCAILVRRAVAEVSHLSVMRYAAGRGKSDRLAVLGALRLAGDHKRLGIASTHLDWQRNQTTPEQHLGRLQLMELFAGYQALVPGCDARLIAGDFNETSQSCVLDEARRQGWYLGAKTQRPWDTTNINGRCRKIDYILYSTPELTPYPEPLASLSSYQPLPTAQEPSDHLPLVIGFR